jgi:MoaA/NifB/PqqE/SkfB family radical SAM enzyme
MITEFTHESFLPCNINEISYEFGSYKVADDEIEKTISLNSDISITSCTNNYLLIDQNEVYITENSSVLEFLSKINSSNVKFNELNDEEKEICQNLLFNKVCKLADDYSSKKIRTVSFPENFLEKNDLTKFGWFPCIPILIEIDVTNKCNQKCIHCYQQSNNEYKVTDEMIVLLRKWCIEAGKSGVPYIRFLGGEPFIIPNLLDICEEAKLAGVLDFQISTNGTLIREKDIPRMSKVFKQIQVSLLSSNPDEHDQITGLKGSFIKATDNIKKMIKAGIKVNANFVVMKQNFHRIEEIADLMYQFGGSVRYLALFLDGRATNLPTISEEEKEIIINSVSKVMEKYNGKMKVNSAGIPIIRDIPTTGSFYGCPAGRTVLRLSVDNQQVAPCTRENGQHYNEMSINDIWYQDFLMKYRNPPSCDCDFTDFCGGPCITEVNRLNSCN